MIKRWIEFNESFKKGQKIQSKIDILREISNDLSDMGLKIDIWSGSWRDSGVIMKSTNKPIDPSKFIIMMIDDDDSVLDEENYYEDELKDKKEILEFEEDLKSHGMTPRWKVGFSDKVYFYFDKGKSTDTDILDTYRD